MRFTLVGAGAIGALWALALHRAGHQVHLVTRRNEHEVELGFEDGKPVCFPANNTDLIEQSDAVLLCVKAFHVEAAINQIAPKLHPDMPMILMHNGMGTAELALERLPQQPLLLATTSHGSLMLSPSTIKHTGAGETRLGGINATGKQCDFLAEVFSHTLAPCYWEDNIEMALWHKLAVNCLINPLTALKQCQNGALTKPDMRPQLEALSTEVAAVMQAEGVAVSQQAVLQRGLDVAHATAENFSSMNRDVHFKRPSEIDYITGFLIRRADAHGVAVPENRALYSAIKNLEQSYDNT